MKREDMDKIVAASEWKGYWESLINENTVLRERVKALEQFEQQVKTLQALCGYVEDGSSDSVTISQDDATGTWHITVGYSPRKRKSFWGESFDGVFLKAKSYVEEMQEFV